jgi:hypothetical protein
MAAPELEAALDRFLEKIRHEASFFDDLSSRYYDPATQRCHVLRDLYQSTECQDLRDALERRRAFLKARDAAVRESVKIPRQPSYVATEAANEC